MRNELFMMLGAVALIAAGCHTDETVAFGGGAGGFGSTGDVAQPVAGAGQSDMIEQLESALEADGFIVQRGAFSFIDLSDCCDLGYCSANNPSSPYANLKLPPAPGEATENPGADGNLPSKSWRLRPDEAVLFIGALPPKAKYASFVPNMVDRADPLAPGERSDSLNHMVIRSAGTPDGGPGDPFGTQTVVVATADASINARVVAATEAAGLPKSITNTLPIPSELAIMGLQQEADTFSVLFRVALFDDEAAGEAYVANPGATVLRITPIAQPKLDPFPKPPLREAGTGSGEDYLKPALLALHNAILAAHPGLATRKLVGNELDNEGYECIETYINCRGDNRDTRYFTTDIFQFKDDDFIIVYGINHEATGKVSYSNFTVTAMKEMVGVDSVASPEMVGSAAKYLPNHPRVDKLFAWKIARHCNNDEPHCMALPVACPGVPIDGYVSVTFRTYLEPQTKTGPIFDELVADRAIRFRPW